METEAPVLDKRKTFFSIGRRTLLFLSVFGPATITAMADNDAAGVATYSIAGAKLGYPILFLLIPITILLAVTQEMGMRLIGHYKTRISRSDPRKIRCEDIPVYFWVHSYRESRHDNRRHVCD